MTEKETFLNIWDQEFKTSLKVLNSFPEEKLNLKPAEKSKDAKDLAWTVASTDIFIEKAMKGTLTDPNGDKAPSTMKEIVQAGSKVHPALLEKIKKMSDAEFTQNVKFFTGPGKMGDVPLNQVLWMCVFDHIHHRGQFSVYLRLAGAKVPSIYGPTADEPWM
jgi:uncharacterized damage-inducible protein DinB